MVNGVSPNTIKSYQSDLRGFFNSSRTPKICCATPVELEAAMASYLTLHRTVWAARTLQRRLVAFRSWATFHGAPSGFLGAYRTPSPDRPLPHPLPEGINGVRAMLDVAIKPKHKALIALCGLMGLRVSEAVSVRPKDFDLTGKFDDWTLSIIGKGSKQRIIPVELSTWTYLQEAHDLAFFNHTTLVDRSESGARKIVTRLAVRAGISRRVASHDLRATLATTALDNTKDLRAVQQILGHASVTTTQIYTDVSQKNMRTALNVL